MYHSHIDHVRAHLERVRYGHLVDPAPEKVYLGAEEENHFWELIGLRLAGCPVLVLALLRFQRLDLPGIAYARESLGTYLSTLPTPRSVDEAGALTAVLPSGSQKVSFFLKRMRAGAKMTPVTLDPARIEVAFDFRLQNPYLIPDFRAGAGKLHNHYYRTVDGHVIRGRSHEIPATAPEELHRFATISSPQQVTPMGVYPLPALFVNRHYLALRAEVPTRETLAAVMKWVPFLPASAKPESILSLPAPREPAKAARKTPRTRTDSSTVEQGSVTPRPNRAGYTNRI